MNPILHDLQNKQWIWTATNASHQMANTKLKTGYESLDKVLSNGFPIAGMIHIESPLGCGEMRLILSVLKQQDEQNNSAKLYIFINPPFTLNAEFLLAQNISLSELIVVHTNNIDDALWSAEQSAKSGACYAVFMWQQTLTHIQVRKLEHASQQGNCYCIWLHNHTNSDQQTGHACENTNVQSNLPLSLSLSISRQADTLSIKVNKQKVGWAQNAVKISLPFTTAINRSRQQTRVNDNSKVVAIHANR